MNIIKTFTRNKDECKLFMLLFLFYSIIYMIFFVKTTVFYNTYDRLDILFNTDTGHLFYKNMFLESGSNIKHSLFRGIVGAFALLPKLLSVFIYNIFKKNPVKIYAIGLFIIQNIFSSASIVLVYRIMKDIGVKKYTKIILIVIMTISFPQMFFTLNLERFIFAEFSIILFVYVVFKQKIKNVYQECFLAILLFGITATNIYIYCFNLLLEYKFKIKDIIRRFLTFLLLLYFSAGVVGATGEFVDATKVLHSDSKEFIFKGNLIEKFILTLKNLLYPSIFFPNHYIKWNLMIQDSKVNIFNFIVFLILFILCIYTIIKYKNKRIIQLCLVILFFNIFLVGVLGYDLNIAAIMSPHFSFTIIILLAFFSKNLNIKYNKVFNVFLFITAILIAVSDFYGFKDIYYFGVKYYSVKGTIK